MRSTSLLAVCLAALASSAVALDGAGPRPTPSPHLARRVLNHGLVFPRSPRPEPQGGLPGLLGGSSASSSQKASSGTDTTGTSDSGTTGGVDTNSGSDSSKDAATSSSSTAAAATSSTSTSAAAARPTSSTSSAPASSTTAAPTSTQFVTSQTTSASGGQTSVVQLTSTVSAAASTSTSDAGAAATSAATGTSDSDSTGGSSHTGLIVGVSVVGGVALLGALIFLYMKFGGRRFSDFQDDDADIKWPELKHDDNAAAMQPLPARRTGGAGFDMGDESDGHGARDGEDAHSLQDYGGKGAVSSTALTAAPMGHGGYYDDAPTGYAPATGGSSAQSPYYDPYGQYGAAAGHDVAAQQQHGYYNDQQAQHAHYGGGPPSYAAGGYGGGAGDYGQSADAGMYDNNQGGYGSHSAHTSPAVQPYRVGGHMPGSHY